MLGAHIYLVMLFASVCRTHTHTIFYFLCYFYFGFARDYTFTEWQLNALYCIVPKTTSHTYKHTQKKWKKAAAAAAANESDAHKERVYLTQRNNTAYCLPPILFHSSSLFLLFSFDFSLFSSFIFCLACYCSHRLSFSPLIDYALSHNISHVYRTRHTHSHTHTSHFYSHFLSFHKWYRHHIFFYFFLPKREECTFKFAKFSVENPAAAATFCFGSIVMIIIVASCVSVCVLALPYQFDTTTIFCRSLLPQLLLLTYARLPLFSTI